MMDRFLEELEAKKRQGTLTQEDLRAAARELRKLTRELKERMAKLPRRVRERLL